MTLRGVVRLALLALGALGALFVLGCGGGGTSGGDNPRLVLQQPVEIPTAPGAIGGSVFTVAPYSVTDGTMLIDQAYNAEITLTGQTDQHAAYGPRTTRSSTRGGYNFADVPAGTYTLSATIQSKDGSGRTLTGEVSGVRVRGNIPTLMVNLVLGETASLATFQGTVTQGGQPAAGATVSLEIWTYTQSYPEDKTNETWLITSGTTAADGSFQFQAPAGANSYFIRTHSNTSMVRQGTEVTNVQPGQVVSQDLVLDPAETPQFAGIRLDRVSTTLPSPTALASQQALITRLAAATALGAPAGRLEQLQRRAATRVTRAIGGTVENDIYIILLSADVGVRGFNVYRSEAISDPFIQVGSLLDPYQFNFFDNDPALQDGVTRYYTATSYAANAKESDPAVATMCTPLPQIQATGPDEETPVSRQTGQLTWTAVPGAQSYMVLFFATEPTFNTKLEIPPVIVPGSETSATLLSVPSGTYWWSVSAYNVDDPTWATAASFSPYRKVIVTD